MVAYVFAAPRANSAILTLNRLPIPVVLQAAPADQFVVYAVEPTEAKRCPAAGAPPERVARYGESVDGDLLSQVVILAAIDQLDRALVFCRCSGVAFGDHRWLSILVTRRESLLNSLPTPTRILLRLQICLS